MRRYASEASTIFPLNRITSQDFVESFSSAKMLDDGDQYCFSFEVNDDEFEVYVPHAENEKLDFFRQKALRALESITYFDNLVQESCLEECERSGLDARNYLLSPAFMIVDEEKVSVRYFGTKVNTEWDAVFKEVAEGVWEKVNF